MRRTLTAAALGACLACGLAAPGCTIARSIGLVSTETTPKLEYEKAVTEFNTTNAILIALMEHDKLDPDKIMAAVAFQRLALGRLTLMKADLSDAVVSPTFSDRLREFGGFLGQIEALLPADTVDPRGLSEPDANGGNP